MSFTSVAAYARYSSDNQREESIDAQLRAIRKYCSDQGYVLTATFIDEAKSGTSDDRPSFQEMIKASENGEWSKVIVHKLDRFARDRYDSAIYKKKLKDNGVTLESVLERIDGSPESIILESLLEGMNEYYSRNLSREVTKGMIENALQGKHNGGIPPFGLNVENGFYVINDWESKGVQAMFAMTANGSSLSEVRDFLNNQGYRTRQNKPFTTSTISVMLRNKKYAGFNTWRRTVPQSKNAKRSNKSRAEEDIICIPNAIPQIVDDLTFYDVQRILDARRDRGSNGSRKAVEIYLLQGILKCGHCGSAMVGCRRHSGRSKTLNITYECGGRKRKTHDCKTRGINRDAVENIVIDLIEKEILSPSAMENVKKRLLEIIHQLQSTDTKNASALKTKLAQTEKEIDNIIDAISQGLLSPRLQERLNTLEDTAASLRKTISTDEARASIAQDAHISELIDWQLSKYQNIRSYPRERQKEIIHRFVKEIIISDENNGPDEPNSLKISVILPNSVLSGIPLSSPYLHHPISKRATLSEASLVFL